MSKISWHIEQRKISDLSRWDKNPSKMSEKERIDLHNSFKKFHYVDLVIIDNDNRVIGGHQRLHEMEKNSQFGSNAIIDVRVQNRKLTEKEFEELAVRLNKNHGRWDNELLKNFFNSDDLKDWGFDSHELNDIFDLKELVEDD